MGFLREKTDGPGLKQWDNGSRSTNSPKIGTQIAECSRMIVPEVSRLKGQSASSSGCEQRDLKAAPGLHHLSRKDLPRDSFTDAGLTFAERERGRPRRDGVE